MPKRTQYADDDTLRAAVNLARRLPPTGRKRSEYLLAAAVLEMNERLQEAMEKKAVLDA